MCNHYGAKPCWPKIVSTTATGVIRRDTPSHHYDERGCVEWGKQVDRRTTVTRQLDPPSAQATHIVTRLSKTSMLIVPSPSHPSLSPYPVPFAPHLSPSADSPPPASPSPRDPRPVLPLPSRPPQIQPMGW